MLDDDARRVVGVTSRRHGLVHNKNSQSQFIIEECLAEILC